MRTLILVSTLFTVTALAGEPSHHPPAQPVSKEFEQLKTLVGTWEGKTQMGGKEVPVTAIYELTSGGTALTERLFAGTPHEMLTVYTPQPKGAELTHYCMMGNQPKMTLKKADDKSLAFEMAGSQGLKSAKEPHMHGLTLAWADADHLKAQWTSFDQGKKKEESTFDLTRKK